MFTPETMEAARQHLPVILLVGPCENDKVDQWLERSPYSTHLASDPFQALERISDFTVRNCPDVIFMHVDSVDKEIAFMQAIVSTDESAIPIIGFHADGKSGDSIDALAERLVQLIPHHSIM